MNAAENKAVFLSYASQDAEAARKICDALRGAGVEVWFDQSELRGGDAWDAKIRKQIKECALFVPIISANTQARREGYFRLEWRLAVERMRHMDDDLPFLVPVVIDDTKDAEAFVPEKFREVQWTRLPTGEAGRAFGERIKVLLESATVGPSPPSGETATVSRPIGSRGRRRRHALLLSAAGLCLLGAAAAFIALKPKEGVAVRPPSVPPQNSAPAAKSIAVLPLASLSGETEAGFFADGVHEDLLTSLFLVRDLKVLSRTSVAQFRGTTKTIRQIAEELGVNYVVEGSVTRSPTKVRITCRLVDARRDEQLWADTFDRPLADLFEMREAIAKEIASALRASLSPEEAKLLRHRPTEVIAAYDLYLQARAEGLAGLNLVARMTKRLSLLEAAVELDPTFAEAWGALAVTHAFVAFQNIENTPARLAKAEEAITQAVRLAPQAPEVIRSLGNYHYYAHRDYDQAIKHLSKVAALEPQNPLGYDHLANIHRRRGDYAAAFNAHRRSAEIDPIHWGVNRNLLWTVSSGRRYADMETQLRGLLRNRRIDSAPTRAERVRATDDAALVAMLPFLQHGSPGAFEQFLATPPTDHFDEITFQQLRKRWAIWRGDYDTFQRLDEVQPVGSDDPNERLEQDLTAAAVYFAANDPARAVARLGGRASALKAKVAAEPRNFAAWGALAQVLAIMGEPDKARQAADNAVELMPEEKDSAAGLQQRLVRMKVWVMVGDRDAAVRELVQLFRRTLQNQGWGDLNVHVLRRHLRYVTLQGHPGFEALLNDPKNNAPLF